MKRKWKRERLLDALDDCIFRVAAVEMQRDGEPWDTDLVVALRKDMSVYLAANYAEEAPRPRRQRILPDDEYSVCWRYARPADAEPRMK